jgi:hypothetical protein
VDHSPARPSLKTLFHLVAQAILPPEGIPFRHSRNRTPGDGRTQRSIVFVARARPPPRPLAGRSSGFVSYPRSLFCLIGSALFRSARIRIARTKVNMPRIVVLVCFSLIGSAFFFFDPHASASHDQLNERRTVV